MSRSVDDLIAATRAEAAAEPFPVDLPVYERAGRDPTEPVLYAGNLDARVCVMGRDLGKDEVAAGQPLIGAGGRLVRMGLLRAARKTPRTDDRALEAALDLAMLTNTVPFKPPGNKAYSEAVKARFRPMVAALLVEHWQGDRILTLGNEAFEWFAPYAEPGAAEALWAREDRYTLDLPVVLRSGEVEKAATLCPLPHPSPLNQRYYGLFPGMLGARLAAAHLLEEASRGGPRRVSGAFADPDRSP